MFILYVSNESVRNSVRKTQNPAYFSDFQTKQKPCKFSNRKALVLAGLAGFEPMNARVKVEQTIDFTVFLRVRKD